MLVFALATVAVGQYVEGSYSTGLLANPNVIVYNPLRQTVLVGARTGVYRVVEVDARRGRAAVWSHSTPPQKKRSGGERATRDCAMGPTRYCGAHAPVGVHEGVPRLRGRAARLWGRDGL